jgi:excisionase family DNA binding protein
MNMQQAKPMSVKDKLLAFDRPLTVEELAKILGVEEQQIYRAARKKDIPSFRVLTLIRFDPVAVCEWFDRQ